MVKVALLDDYQGVAMTSANWAALPPGTEVEAFHDHITDVDALANRLQSFDVVMALRERTQFQRDLLERLPNLKMIATAGMRNAAIDMDAANALGILVCGTSGSSRSTGELAWGLILSLLRHIPQEDAATRAGQWQVSLGIGLQGKTLGLLGLGRIGGQMAEVANAFQMRVIAWSQNLTEQRADEFGALLVSKDELFDQSDVVSIHLVLSERTRGLVGARELGLMKPTAYLVNTSRGPIVDEAALYETLREGRIAGAGIDVFSEEPLPRDYPLLSLKNTVITPHLGYVTTESYQAFYEQTAENVAAFMAGNPTRVVNPEVLDRRRKL
jgi:phosphoglycerate dehydrogenase-like enzyme